MPEKEKRAKPLVKADLPLETYEEQLSVRERIYIEEKLRGSTEKAALIKAGYKTNRKARWIVQEVLRRRFQEMAGRNRVTTERIFGELSQMAFANIEDYLDDDGRTRKFSDIPQEARSNISKYLIKEDGTEITLHSKMDALKTLAKLSGMEPAQKHEHTGKDGEPIEINVEEKKKEILDRIKNIVDLKLNKDGSYS